jgi:hypothetical protein
MPAIWILRGVVVIGGMLATGWTLKQATGTTEALTEQTDASTRLVGAVALVGGGSDDRGRSKHRARSGSPRRYRWPLVPAWRGAARSNRQPQADDKTRGFCIRP